MKKITVLMLALVLCLSLAACGSSVDKQPAIDAFNSASVLLGEISDAVAADEEYYADLIPLVEQMADTMYKTKDLLESDKELTQEQVDDLVTNLNGIEDWCNTVIDTYGI